jgi:hypothetical protein
MILFYWSSCQAKKQGVYHKVYCHGQAERLSWTVARAADLAILDRR